MPASRSRTLKVIALTAAMGLVPFGLAVVGSGFADPRPTVQAAAGVSTPAYAPNWIAISTGTGAGVTLNGPGSQGATETLGAAANCGIRSTGQDLVTLAGSLGGPSPSYSESLASYATGSIGVKEKRSGTSCYQVNAVTDEALRIGLGADVATILGGDAVAAAAYLDVELKGGVRILATATLDDAVVGTFELQSGPEVSQPVTAGAVEFECNLKADSGADSNVSDNCRWPISGPSWLGDDGVVFDTLTLDALAGSFSLEGGADGAVQPPAPLSTPNASIIEIAADTLACNAPTRTEPASADEPEVTVFRLGNADAAACTLIPYALANGPRSAQFLKPLDSQATAQFLWDMKGPLPPGAGTTALEDITIDYETLDADGASQRVALGWCPDASYAGGRFAGYTAAQLTALPDQDEYPGKQFACVVSRTATSVDGSPDVVSVHDVVYVLGDAFMRR